MKLLSVTAVLLLTMPILLVAAELIEVTKRHRPETEPGHFPARLVTEQWKPEETAVIVCDMWDAHHCLNAVRRVEEMAPRMNDVLKKLRESGALVVHAPSSCMDAYENSPARKRAQDAPQAANLPEGIETWLHWIDGREEAAGYPIDHSDGGEDDDPKEHAEWADELTRMGRNPRSPWKRQYAGIEIDETKDVITDDGRENWNVLEHRGIKNVILTGVHTNMCVLGRPFGLRQLARAGKNVVLLRDLTDTMYNPKMPPMVSHFSGTDLIIEHVEKFVCPTISSDQLIGGKPFRFSKDDRPRVVMMIGEKEYDTEMSLPDFATKHLLRDLQVTRVEARVDENAFPGLEDALADADLLFVSVRRRSPPEGQMQAIRDFVASGKPVVGIRTASHAYSLRGKEPPKGHGVWETWDPDVFGGSYNNHYGNELKTFAQAVADHPITKGMARDEFATGGSLYRVRPLAEGTTVLAEGRAEGIEEKEPVAWTFERKDGGRSFCTSLGHVDDFGNAVFVRLLRQGIDWALGREPEVSAVWREVAVPGVWEDTVGGYDGYAWYRCQFRVPEAWKAGEASLQIENVDNACEVYLNGEKVGGLGGLPPNFQNAVALNARIPLPTARLNFGSPNALAVRVWDESGRGGFKGSAPLVVHGDDAVALAGQWDWRPGDDPSWAQERGGPVFVAVTSTTLSAHETTGLPLSAEDSLSRFRLATDLAIDLVLSEPLIRQPLHISFDDRGRMWVVQYIQYPNPAGLTPLSRDKVWRVDYDRKPPPPPHAEDSPFRGNDRISIHEDRDGDGTFETHKVFADGLNMATSVAHADDGIWVTNPPYLLFYPDKDKNDIPDGPPEVRLDGFGMEDTHSTANSLKFGPDGWLYGAQGSTVSAAIVRPGIDRPEDAVKSMGQHIWRYHPQRRIYEIFAEGGGNTYGVDFDSKGRVYSGHNGGDTRGFHYVQGGYFQKSFGKHGALTNPFAFGYFPPMKHGSVARFTHQFVIYENDALPKPYRNKLWGVDVLHNNIVCAEMIPDGSTFSTKDIGRPVASDDTWFRPVHITEGPDGNLYVADWYDRQVNHYRNHEGRIDHAMGRVYRVRAKEPQPRAAVPPTALRTFLDACRAGRVTGEMSFAALASDDPHVRRWAIRIAGDERAVSERTVRRWLDLAESEADPEVRSQLAASARRIQPAEGLRIAAAMARRDSDAEDPHIPLMIWWAIEARCGEAADAVLALFEDETFWKCRIVRETIASRVMKRFALAGKSADLGRCARLLALAPSARDRAHLVGAFEEAYSGREMSNLPPALLTELAKAEGDIALMVRIRQGNTEASMQGLKKIAASPDKNFRLITVFGETDVPECVPVFLDLLATSESEEVRRRLMGALQGYAEARIANTILAQYPRFTAREKDVARSVLATRREWSREMLGSPSIEDAELSLPILFKIRAHEDAETEARVNALIEGRVGDKESEIARVRGVVTAGEGIPKSGQLLFEQRCASCHAMYGQGGAIGPDLTSYQRADLENLLLAVIAPSAEIREGFANTIVTTDNGAVHSGFLTEQTDATVSLRGLAGQEITIPRATVVRQTTLPSSLMPEGLLSGLDDQALRDFVAFLRSTTPPF